MLSVCFLFQKRLDISIGPSRALSNTPSMGSYVMVVFYSPTCYSLLAIDIIDSHTKTSDSPTSVVFSLHRVTDTLYPLVLAPTSLFASLSLLITELPAPQPSFPPHLSPSPRPAYFRRSCAQKIYDFLAPALALFGE